MTRQEFRKESDMGTLIQRYTKTGSFYDPLKPSVGSPRVPAYLDCASIPDFAGVQDKISAAMDAFGRLPSSVRDRFNNNLTAFVAWISDPANREEAVKEGLLPSTLGVTTPEGQKPVHGEGKPVSESPTPSPTPPPTPSAGASGLHQFPPASLPF
jgi:hypothetical protein